MKRGKSFKSIIFPTITTISKNWRGKIKELNELGLKEICFFPTCLKEKERKTAYKLLEKSGIKEIPLVHIREDMKFQELDYLIKNYKTRFLASHTESQYPSVYDYSKYKNIIFIENVFNYFDENELKNYGGICLDLSHLENDRLLYKDRFKHNTEIIKKYPIGCNHISAVKKTVHIDKRVNREEEKLYRYDSHKFENLSEFDYLKKYPKNYFSDIIAIELENSIEDQLSAKEYILKILEV